MILITLINANGNTQANWKKFYIEDYHGVQ